MFLRNFSNTRNNYVFVRLKKLFVNLKLNQEGILLPLLHLSVDWDNTICPVFHWHSNEIWPVSRNRFIASGRSFLFDLEVSLIKAVFNHRWLIRGTAKFQNGLQLYFFSQDVLIIQIVIVFGATPSHAHFAPKFRIQLRVSGSAKSVLARGILCKH